MLYLWCWQMRQAAMASHCWWKESLFQEKQIGGMLLQNHIKCGAYLEYFVSLLPLSDVSPVLIDLHNIRLPQGQYKPWVRDWFCSTTYYSVKVMSDLHSQTIAPTASLVVRRIDHRHACWHGATMWWMVLGSSWNKVSSYLWASVFLHAQQCWNVPVTGQANPELDCLVYQGLLEVYHLRQASTGVAGFGTSKRHCSLTCFVESCATEATFLLCLLKASLPLLPPKSHCKSILRQPQIWYIFSFFVVGRGVSKHLFSNNIYNSYICLI